jgi:phage I-like protein
VKRRRDATISYSRIENSPEFVSTFAVALETDEAPEWIELIPAGKFSAVDGRGPFENQDPDSIVAASIAKMPPVGLVLDYDHATDLAAPEGRPAPAAGWLKQFKVENGAIFARIEWTSDAAEEVKEKKYRYVSPVFEHSKDGKVERILRAALTNNPALINLPALAQAEQIAPRRSFAPLRMTEGNEPGVQRMAKEEKRPKLSEVMATLESAYPDTHPRKLMEAAACLMADDDGDEDAGGGGADDGGAAAATADAADPYDKETEEQMATRQAEEMAKCSTDEEKASMTAKHAEQKERFAKRKEMAHQQPGGGDSKVISPSISSLIDRHIAKHPLMLSAQNTINQLRAERSKEQAVVKVDAAIKAGRLIPSQREWAIEYCSADEKGFEKFIGAQPKIIQSGADNTFTARIGDPKDEVLSSKEIEVCRNLGLPAMHAQYSVKAADGTIQTVVKPDRFVELFAAAKKDRLSHNVHLD